MSREGHVTFVMLYKHENVVRATLCFTHPHLTQGES